MKALGFILIAVVVFLVLATGAHFVPWSFIHGMNHWANTHPHCSIINTKHC